ncbi:glycosyltransferase [Catellatospora sp. NPDC049609]|uniref:glycosyltransferase n=1 Tax=Catellatospora sp. NPDC049609 TaxID=3155505 RepID=UPI0034302057
MPAPAPVRVVRVEVGQPLPELSPQRPDGRRYGSAYVIVRDGGQVVGRRLVPLGEQTLHPDALAERLSGLWHGGPARPALRPPEPAPFISVVVPSAMQRPVPLARCIGRLAALDYPSFEVVVVDNRPTGAPERARLHAELSAHPRVRVVTEPVRGASAARNRGIAAARGEIVAFTDDDIDVDPSWLTAIAARFAADPRADCVTGWVFPAELETPAQVWFENSGSTIGEQLGVVSYQRDTADRWTVRAHRAHDPAADERVPVFRGVFGGSGNLAVRAAVLAERGAFHPALGAGTVAGGGEDVEFLTRLLHHGHRVTMDPAVAVFHHHRTDFADLRRQMYGYGTGYTAALTALIAADVRHLAGLARLVTALARISRRRGTARTPVQYPSSLRWAERRGLLSGPLAYLRSRLALARRRGASHAATPPLEHAGNLP